MNSRINLHGQRIPNEPDTRRPRISAVCMEMHRRVYCIAGYEAPAEIMPLMRKI
jgi:hypothetical protein